MIKCPYLEFARDKIQRHMAKKPHSSHKSRERRPSKHDNSRRQFKDKKHVRGHSAEVDTSSSYDSPSSENDEEKHRPFAQADNSDTEETAAISSAGIYKIPPSEWFADTAATSTMTVHIKLYRGALTRISRPRIKVGGGELWSDRKGTVKMKVAGRDSV